ncbi:hypothetical protein PPTG_18162 [Phytophthora nicotianae INRA-310]|uniref:Crinkler effector protein N-terminal domain-containing protein n=1 Tax=Phytophthora nicotianae (strain INRA-310) TaxID=761204 RepID=W2PIU1_PHYN3|nr:hypothetical protein PPTG_18162 [Phytophthora nicotianae INRA-310]ETN00159.1 hypothetical protein PPTG_18162 [Phytophthora nicotianae INRA-310]
MTEVELECAVYGEATMFLVKIASDAKRVDSNKLTLYLARKEGGVWLKDDHHVTNFMREDVDKQYVNLRPSWKLDDETYFGKNFKPERKEIHVLVELRPSDDIFPNK